MKKVRFPHFFGMKKIIFVFLVTLEKEDKAMIAVIAIFGIFLLIGTIADTILNIMHLDIVPDSLLKVKKYIFLVLPNTKPFHFRSFKGFLYTVTHSNYSTLTM